MVNGGVPPVHMLMEILSAPLYIVEMRLHWRNCFEVETNKFSISLNSKQRYSPHWGIEDLNRMSLVCDAISKLTVEGL